MKQNYSVDLRIWRHMRSSEECIFVNNRPRAIGTQLTQSFQFEYNQISEETCKKLYRIIPDSLSYLLNMSFQIFFLNWSLGSSKELGIFL